MTMLRRKVTINMPVEVEVAYELDEEKIVAKVVDVTVSQHGDLDDVAPWILAHVEVLDNDHTLSMTMLRDLLHNEERALHLSNPNDEPLKPLCKEREDTDLVTGNFSYFMNDMLCPECMEIFNGIWDRNEEANAKAR